MRIVPAVFGKLPAHGDFVVRGLDPAARQAWDRLASDGLARAEAAFGPAFEQAHEAAQPWRFLVSPESGLSQGWGAGVLVPSVDRVGRRFVLVTMIQGIAPADVTRKGRDLTARLEDVAFTAFTHGRDADALLAGISAAAAPFDLDQAVDWPGEGLEDRWWSAESGAELTGAIATSQVVERMLQPPLAGAWP